MESWKRLEKSNGERAKIKSNGRWVDVSDKVLTRAELSRLVSRLSMWWDGDRSILPLEEHVTNQAIEYFWPGI